MPPTANSNNKGLKIGLIIGAVVLLVLCLCGGLVLFAAANLEEDSKSTASATNATASPSPSLSAIPTPSGASPDHDFTRGDCVVNDGTATDAKLRKVPCGPGTYEVLLKIPFSTDAEQCKNLFPSSTGADTTYTWNAPGTLNDYVLCMKEL